MIVFKLRARNGLFSTGGSTPDFHAVGKTWRRRMDLTNHLIQLRPKWMDVYLAQGVEVIEVEIVEEVKSTANLADWSRAALTRKLERNEARRSAQCMLKRVALISQLETV